MGGILLLSLTPPFSAPLLLQVVLPLMIRGVDNIVHRRLRFGYDVGKGFVTGEEEMLQQFDRFGALVHEKIAQELRRRAEDTRLDVIKSLGEWEENTSWYASCTCVGGPWGREEGERGKAPGGVSGNYLRQRCGRSMGDSGETHWAVLCNYHRCGRPAGTERMESNYCILWKCTNK